MFCPNCGSNIKEGELFCANCGASSNQSVQENKKVKKSKAGKVWGIVLIVLGALAFLGSIANGSILEFDFSNIVSKLLMIGFLVAGICLVSKKK